MALALPLNCIKFEANIEKAMKPENLWQQFDTLSIEAKREVIDFIAFLQIRYERSAIVKKAKRAKLKNESFIGIWKIVTI